MYRAACLAATSTPWPSQSRARMLVAAASAYAHTTHTRPHRLITASLTPHAGGPRRHTRARALGEGGAAWQILPPPSQPHPSSSATASPPRACAVACIIGVHTHRKQTQLGRPQPRPICARGGGGVARSKRALRGGRCGSLAASVVHPRPSRWHLLCPSAHVERWWHSDLRTHTQHPISPSSPSPSASLRTRGARGAAHGAGPWGSSRGSGSRPPLRH
jgi:uncharacterized protein YndB with AHSA1/START domain